MSENNFFSGMGSENRMNERSSLRHRLETTFIDEELPGELIDWSKNGMQVYVRTSLSEKIEYGVVFRIHRNFFVADKKNEDYTRPSVKHGDERDLPRIEEWGGRVQWVKRLEDWAALGIRFEEGLEGAAFKGSPRYITQRDFCHLWIFPKSEELVKRIEVWIENPKDLEVLKQDSRLNETEVINTMLKILAEGVNQEEEGWDKERALKRMLDRIMGVFEMTS